ncbi:MAG: hypothetical protein AB7E52_08645 [Bdellovibrionales bacterium]
MDRKERTMKRVGISLSALAATLFYVLPAWAQEAHEVVQEAVPGVAEASAHGAEHGGGSKTLPQLDLTLYPGVLFWTVVLFVLLYILMGKIAMPRVQETIAKRRSILDADLESARQASEEAQVVVKAYEESLHEARRKAQDTVGNIVAQATAEAAEEQDRQNQELHHRMVVAQENLATAKQDAMRDTQNFVNDLVSEVVAKVMQSGIEPKTSGARK